MNWIVTDALIEQARRNPAETGMTREERAAVFNDRMLEEQAANARYTDRRTVKETIDALIAAGSTEFKTARSDELGRAYAKMALRRRRNA